MTRRALGRGTLGERAMILDLRDAAGGNDLDDRSNDVSATTKPRVLVVYYTY